MAQQTGDDVPTFDDPRTEDLSRSEGNRVAVARLADEMLGGDALWERVEAVVADHAEDLLASDEFAVDAEDVDRYAVGLLAAFTAKQARNGPYLLRNDAVTVAEADLEVGDLIHMESALDADKILDFRVTEADPDCVEVGVRRVDGDTSVTTRSTTTSFRAGLVRFSDRFVVQRDHSKDVEALIDVESVEGDNDG